ncbi:hypothetical protein Bca52824_084650 [Brassica carinata]|uniref:Uncharacterized protein n=1 Tax=Brassica carinata TaxID=52824 RepID=A0A8X7PRU1_BRACI|nr:hypothetical protein Bca52824_084650 [Brassica carinata]
MSGFAAFTLEDLPLVLVKSLTSAFKEKEIREILPYLASDYAAYDDLDFESFLTVYALLIKVVLADHANLARASLDSGTQQQDPSKQTQCFTYRELATATNNFRLESMIGHGGFGSVFKGKLVFPPGQVTLNIYHLEL